MSATPLLPAAAAAGAVLLASVAAASARRWHGADRARSRLGLPGGTEPRVPARLAAALDSAGVARSQHPALVRIWTAAAVVAGVAVLILPAGPVVAVVVVGGPPALLMVTSGRAARRRVRELPAALESIAGGLRAGHSLAWAVTEAGRAPGPLAAEFADVARHTRGGRPVTEALRRWADAHDHGTRLAAASMAVAAEVGGPGADAIDATAAGLRDRAALDDEIAALSVQARASAVLLSITPVVFTALLATADASSARFLFGTRLGWACLTVGIGLDVLGAWWMHRLVRAAR